MTPVRNIALRRAHAADPRASRGVAITCLVLLLPCGAIAQPRDYRGLWAGERMHCDWPATRLHRLDAQRMHSPAQYEDSMTEDCRVQRRRGASPEWVFELQCRATGRTEPSRDYPATRTLTLLDPGRLRVVTLAGRGNALEVDEWVLCRRLAAPSPTPGPTPR